MPQGRSTKIVTMIKWIWTIRLSIKNSHSGGPLQLGVFGIGSSSLNHRKRCPLIISLDEYADSGPYLGTVCADTDNPVL